MKKGLAKLIFILSFLFINIAYANDKIVIFAAASLTNAMQELKQIYLENHPQTTLQFSFASSSVLAKQIEQGAPADIFISADQKWMDYLLTKQIVKQKHDLLKNKLVLIAPLQSKVPATIINQKTPWRQILPANEKLAIGDPNHVPAGIYAQEALTNLGAYKLIQSQFIPANNVRDALMLVERDEVALGIVYSTDAKISNKVKVIGEFPDFSFKPIRYPMALLSAKGKDFYQFLRSNEAAKVFEKLGFEMINNSEN